MASQKGQNFERDIARYLSLWWTDGNDADVFWRNKVRKTSKTPEAERQMGDLTTTKTIGLPFIEMFNIELKSGYSKTRLKNLQKRNEEANKKRAEKGKDPIALSVRNTPWDLLEIIDSKQKDENFVILQFWNQCKTDAELSCRIPLLIFKRDYHEEVVVINTSDFDDIIDHIGNLFSKRLVLCLNDNEIILTFYQPSDFFNWLRPEIVKLIHQRKINEKHMDAIIYKKRV